MPPRILITAGPTHEPIDAVRYIGNRSSGRLGIALADAAHARGWATRLLLGPTHLRPSSPDVAVHTFRTCAELGELLAKWQPECDLLVMAAAVADYRPKAPPEQLAGKMRRSDRAMSIELEPTEDLLAGCAGRRRDGQLLVGFALEPESELLQSAREKLRRKGIDLIVANPLETMESASIEAYLLGPQGVVASTGAVDKARFGPWLLDQISPRMGRS